MALEILTIDFSSTMIASAVCGVVLLISYLIYKFGIAEKSFEEVIEEQKRRSIEEEMQQKSEKVKKEKKFKRNWSKKKEKVEQEVVHEPVQIEDKKEPVPSFEIIEPKEVKIKQKVKTKSNASSSIPATSSESAPTGEKPKKTEPVADKVQDKKKDVHESVKEVEKIKSEPKINEITRATEVNEVTSNISVQATSAPAVTSSKKKKKEPVEKDIIPMTTSKFLSLIKETELDTEEIQTLIDILLNKQKDSTGWTKKNDQLASTKKNLQEKEQLLEQEKRQTQAFTSKLKDLREEYNLLKSKMAAQEKISQEKIAHQHQDIQGFKRIDKLNT